MKNMNTGIAQLLISNKLKETYFTNNSINETLLNDFLNVIKNSPILQLEVKVYNNIKNKTIYNDILATRFIDNNIKLFEIYTIKEIDKEHEKLTKFISDGNLDNINENEEIKLYESINNLIKESLNDYNKINVNDIHESFTYILTHIKSNKNNIDESVELIPIDSNVIEIAVHKFNEKYKTLNEDDSKLFKQLINYNDNEKKDLLESYITENLLILESINNDNIKDNIMKAIQKLKEMKYNKHTVNDDIISLYELKKDLL